VKRPCVISARAAFAFQHQQAQLWSRLFHAQGDQTVGQAASYQYQVMVWRVHESYPAASTRRDRTGVMTAIGLAMGFFQGEAALIQQHRLTQGTQIGAAGTETGDTQLLDDHLEVLDHRLT